MAGKIKNPLVWIDCEMTGLDSNKDTILSLCCLITDGDLNLADNEGYEAVIHHDKHVLDGMNDWCIKTHGESGLTEACIQSATTAEDAADGLFEYIKRHVPDQRIGVLAGNSVHCDKDFLSKSPYKKVIDHLFYRILDVSTIKEAARRWSDPQVLEDAPEKRNLHTARSDIIESIKEAQFYRKAIFKPATASRTTE